MAASTASTFSSVTLARPTWIRPASAASQGGDGVGVDQLQQQPAGIQGGDDGPGSGDPLAAGVHRHRPLAHDLDPGRRHAAAQPPPRRLQAADQRVDRRPGSRRQAAYRPAMPAGQHEGAGPGARVGRGLRGGPPSGPSGLEAFVGTTERTRLDA